MNKIGTKVSITSSARHRIRMSCLKEARLNIVPPEDFEVVMAILTPYSRELRRNFMLITVMSRITKNIDTPKAEA